MITKIECDFVFFFFGGISRMRFNIANDPVPLTWLRKILFKLTFGYLFPQNLLDFNECTFLCRLS